MVETGHARLCQIKHLAGRCRRGVGGIQRNRRPFDREPRSGGEGRGGREALVDEQVDACTGPHERPAGARVTREAERQAGEVEAVADGAALRVDDGE